MNGNERLMKSLYALDEKFKNIEYIENKTLSFQGYLIDFKDYEEYKKNKI